MWLYFILGGIFFFTTYVFQKLIGRPTGNNVSGHYKQHSFFLLFLFFLFFLFFSLLSTLLIEGVLGLQNLFRES